MPALAASGISGISGICLSWRIRTLPWLLRRKEKLITLMMSPRLFALACFSQSGHTKDVLFVWGQSKQSNAASRDTWRHRAGPGRANHRRPPDSSLDVEAGAAKLS